MPDRARHRKTAQKLLHCSRPGKLEKTPLEQLFVKSIICLMVIDEIQQYSLGFHYKLVFSFLALLEGNMSKILSMGLTHAIDRCMYVFIKLSRYSVY